MKENMLAILPLLLGQMPAVTSSELGGWLLSAAAMAVIANQGIAFWKNISGGLKEMPPPGETYVHKTVCKLLHIGVEKRLGEQSERIGQSEEATEALRLEIKNDVRGIHDRINAILAALGELKGKFK